LAQRHFGQPALDSRLAQQAAHLVRPGVVFGIAQAGDLYGLRWPIFRLPFGLEGERQVRRQVAVVGPEGVVIDLRQRVVTRQPQGDPHTVVLVLLAERAGDDARRLLDDGWPAGVRFDVV